MSSFEKTAGKNLDEILASIRKTLADESTPPQPGFPQPDPLAEASAGEPARRNGDRIDDDFADLLAGGLGVFPSQPQEKDTTAPEPAEPKDPLWFLRPSGGGEPQALPLPDHGPRLAPETLADGVIPPPQRPSFSPQFIADRARNVGDGVANGTSSSPSQEKPSAASPSATDPGTTTETKPAATGLAPDAIGPGTANREAAQMAPGAGQAAAGAAAPATSPAGRDADSKLGVPPASAAKPDPARPAGAAGVPVSPLPAVSPGALPLKPDAAQSPAALGGTKPMAAGPAKPTAPAAVVSPAAMAGPAIKSASAAPRAAAGLNGAASAPTSAAAASMPAADAAPASQTQALEQIIEQLLEPLLHRWVEANLPRMVEVAIRAEVARVLDKKSPNGHASDRKL